MEHVGDISESDIEGMFATNVLGLIAMTQLLVKGQHLRLQSSSSSSFNARFQEEAIRSCH